MSTKFQPSREASLILGVHPNSLRKWADTGEINCIRTKSGQRRYDVDSYIGNSTISTTIVGKIQFNLVISPKLRFQTKGQWINCDIVGARNILLRALVDQPHKVTWQLANVNKINFC